MARSAQPIGEQSRRTLAWRDPLRRRRSGSAGLSQRELGEVLSSYPAFGACRGEDLQALARSGRLTTLPARWTFLHESTPADALYVLLVGEVRVLVGGAERAVLGPGAVLGEMGLLGRSLRRATVVTCGAVQVLRVEYEALEALLAAHPHLATCLEAVYAEHRAAQAPPADLPGTSAS